MATPASASPAPLDLEAMPIPQLVHHLHAGRITPDALCVELRQQCVAQLDLEGFTNSEIAQFLKVCERTIRRDRAAVRQAQALRPGLALGDELLGQFHQFTLASIQRLHRLTRDTHIAPSARLNAEIAISRIYQRFLETTRQLEYLDSGARRLRHEIETDPEETRRHHERERAEWDKLTKLSLGASLRV